MPVRSEQDAGLNGASGLTPSQALSFELPSDLEASMPPEARGLGRDAIRLMVSYSATDSIVHKRFYDLPEFLCPGDLLVVNKSAALPAALPATGPDGTSRRIHLSGRVRPGRWVVEVRDPHGISSRPYVGARPGDLFTLPGSASVLLDEGCGAYRERDEPPRLWIATVRMPDDWLGYLNRFGGPIYYDYIRGAWPISYYQTVYGSEPGSAEMPSAGRPFTLDLLRRIVRRGVRLAGLVLHTGVSSPESDEPPYDEWFRVPTRTARLVNETRAAGGRIVAVGTTVVRALESAAARDGAVQAISGWTSYVVTPERGVRAVNGLITGFHEPRSSHLMLLSAVAPRHHLDIAYAEALKCRYLWHEFGDVHLILSDPETYLDK